MPILREPRMTSVVADSDIGVFAGPVKDSAGYYAVVYADNPSDTRNADVEYVERVMSGQLDSVSIFFSDTKQVDQLLAILEGIRRGLEIIHGEPTFEEDSIEY